MAVERIDANIAQIISENKAAAVFNKSEIHIHLGLGQGSADVTVWTCDLTHDYVTINADYRT